VSSPTAVWFKRDLRAADHRPLAEAAARGPVVPLYIVEPEIGGADDFSSLHWDFLRESLHELNERLTELGAPLVVRQGEVVEVLEQLRRETGFTHLFAHEETSNALGYSRDRRVRRWAKANRIQFKEWPTNGVQRRLKNRDGWSREWERRMAEAITPAPERLQTATTLKSEPIPTSADLSLSQNQVERQSGGETPAHQTLETFLAGRGRTYFKHLSSPVTAFDACSRLSPYLTWGNLSLRQVVQSLRAAKADLEGRRDKESTDWRRSFRAIDGRLHWRCHFIQKIEDEPEIENHCFVRVLDGLREREFNADHFEAWKAGQTGYPMVDACMRALLATGWLNFRMRAMLASFAAYHLWLHWKPTAEITARTWLDYEPGIHYSQFQMQSGTTGINTIRIYSPTKQAQDHDPEGTFIRRWIPELRDVPGEFIHEPWNYGNLRATGNPLPVVDHAVAVKRARAKLTEARRQPEFREEAREVQGRHGSRRKTSDRRPRSKPKSEQASLFS
jgi:deoxyribodipyrimidine photo-lyase